MTTATQLLRSFTNRVMPAKAGISSGIIECHKLTDLDPSFRWGDGEA